MSGTYALTSANKGQVLENNAGHLISVKLTIPGNTPQETRDFDVVNMIWKNGATQLVEPGPVLGMGAQMPPRTLVCVMGTDGWAQGAENITAPIAYNSLMCACVASSATVTVITGA
jgi:hypothetical protein